MSDKKILKTPITDADLADIHIGDVIYLEGIVVTCHDVTHRRLINEKRDLPVDLHGLAVIHAGPIVKTHGFDKYEMVSIGSTTSMRMDSFERQFIERTGVKLIIGKGGMGADTQEACKTHKALHVVYPAGCAVHAAAQVEEIQDAYWTELGMSEALWICKVKEFGPLIVSIDTHGNNMFEENKIIYNERKNHVLTEICEQVKFIK